MAVERAGVAGTTRASRESASRKMVWRPPNRLDAPEAPEGYSYRWVRKQIGNEPDHSNVVGRKRQHYEPVKPEELGNFEVEVGDGSEMGMVTCKDLILMKVPNVIKEQRDQYYADQTKSLTEAANRHWDSENSDDRVQLSRVEKDSTRYGDRDRPVTIEEE